MNVTPITLEGRWARLEPLAERHADDLAAISGDEEIWRYMPASLMDIEQVQAWIAETLELQRSGAVLPFAIVEQSSGRAIGSTRYLDIRPKDRGLEIGWTWLARSAWRTAINSECKYMLLRNAFETLGLYPRPDQDRRAQPALAAGDRAHRRPVRGHPAPAYRPARRHLPRLGLLQHPAHRVAGGEGAAW